MKKSLLALLLKLIVLTIFWGSYPRELQEGAPTVFAGFSICLWIFLGLLTSDED